MFMSIYSTYLPYLPKFEGASDQADQDKTLVLPVSDAESSHPGSVAASGALTASSPAAGPASVAPSFPGRTNMTLSEQRQTRARKPNGKAQEKAREELFRPADQLPETAAPGEQLIHPNDSNNPNNAILVRVPQPWQRIWTLITRLGLHSAWRLGSLQVLE